MAMKNDDVHVRYYCRVFFALKSKIWKGMCSSVLDNMRSEQKRRRFEKNNVFITVIETQSNFLSRVFPFFLFCLIIMAWWQCRVDKIKEVKQTMQQTMIAHHLSECFKILQSWCRLHEQIKSYRKIPYRHSSLGYLLTVQILLSITRPNSVDFTSMRWWSRKSNKSKIDWNTRHVCQIKRLLVSMTRRMSGKRINGRREGKTTEDNINFHAHHQLIVSTFAKSCALYCKSVSHRRWKMLSAFFALGILSNERERQESPKTWRGMSLHGYTSRRALNVENEEELDDEHDFFISLLSIFSNQVIHCYCMIQSQARVRGTQAWGITW